MILHQPQHRGRDPSGVVPNTRSAGAVRHGHHDFLLRYLYQGGVDSAQSAHLLSNSRRAVVGPRRPFEATCCALIAPGTGLPCSCGGCSQARRDGGVGEGGQDGGLRQPGGEVGFEGQLVCVAGSHALAGLLLHHVVGEEDVGLF